MRKQFVNTIESILPLDERLILLLGDFGVFGFRNSFEQYPKRIYNIGILEQSTVGLAAGLAMCGFIPVVHTIAPFLIERAVEQLKNDFCYQRLGGNFISVGASYDYAALGCTHQCPGDIGILKNLPGMEIVLPGTAQEFDRLFSQSYNNGRPTYFRLSEQTNSKSQNVKFGKATIIKKGKMATIIAVGPLLDRVLEASKNFDVTVLYYTTLAPFDSNTLKNNCPTNKILLCEPYYSGALTNDIIDALSPCPLRIEFAGLPHIFFTNYGTVAQQDKAAKLTAKDINKKIIKLINE